MFIKEIDKMSNVALQKVNFMKKNTFGLLVLSLLAGVFIGLGVLLSFTIGGSLGGAPYTKVIMGVSFGIALSLVIMAGAELFTGNNLVLGVGLLKREISILDLIKYWVICYIGNWLGSIFIAYLFFQGGFAVDSVGTFISGVSSVKMNIPFITLLTRGILCNLLVCLAIWCSNKMTSESGKLIMIFWCLFAFVTTGFEHSIANMTLLSISMFNPMVEGISFSGYFYNIFTVTLGNIIGGTLLVALPYYVVSKGEK